MKFVTIPKHPRYEISKEGVIRNKKNLKIKSQYIGSTGYYMVSFSYNNKSKPQRVHRLLASAFIPNINNYKCINHIDGNKLNNDLDNLEWCNHKQNMNHAFKTGLVNNKGEKNGMNILQEEQVIEIKKLLKTGLSQQKIAEKFNVSRSCILSINIGRTWKHTNG